MSTPRPPSTASDPPRGSGLAWGDPARRPVAICALLLAAMAGSAQAAPQDFAIDPANTHVHWEIVHFGTSTLRGRFDAITGTLMLDRDAHAGAAAIDIATGSVSSGTPVFDGVLRGRYLLSTEAFPTARFNATRFVFDADRLTAVEGTLTLRDESHPLTLRAQRFSCRRDDSGREICGGDFETEFRRSLFNITHSLPFVADKMRVVVQIEAFRR